MENIYAIIKDNIVVNNIKSSESPELLLDEGFTPRLNNDNKIVIGQIHDPISDTFISPLEGYIEFASKTDSKVEENTNTSYVSPTKFFISFNHSIDNALTTSSFLVDNATIDNLNLDSGLVTFDITPSDEIISGSNLEPISVELEEEVTHSSLNLSHKVPKFEFYYSSIVE